MPRIRQIRTIEEFTPFAEGVRLLLERYVHVLADDATNPSDLLPNTAECLPWLWLVLGDPGMDPSNENPPAHTKLMQAIGNPVGNAQSVLGLCLLNDIIPRPPCLHPWGFPPGPASPPGCCANGHVRHPHRF